MAGEWKDVPRRVAAGLLAVSVVVAGAAVVRGQEAENDPWHSRGAAAETDKAPWRSSAVTYRNMATAFTLDRSADLTYNPTYAMMFEVTPYWWFGDVLYVTAMFNAMREFTNSDITTERGEWELADTTLTVGGQGIVTIPWVGIDVSAALVTGFPTSKLSRARTQYLSTMLQLTLSRSFDLLSGFSVSLTGLGVRYYNEYTTSEYETPLIPGCIPSQGPCDAFLNSGLRNPAWRVGGQLALSQDFTDFLGVSASAALVTDYLYEQESDDLRVSLEPQEGTDQRYYMVFGAEVVATLMPSLALAVGAATESPQQKLNSEYERPFFNRYSVLYGDIRIKIDGLIDQITSGGETP